MTTPAVTPPAPEPAARPTPFALALNVVRGALIGVAELIPGISGGTVALIVGVYERLIASASHLIGAIKGLLVGPRRGAAFRAEAARVDWWLVAPTLAGMVAIIFTIAGPVESLVSTYPEESRGLFFGLVAASIFVPLNLVPRVPHTVAQRVGGVALFLGAAALAFLLIGVARGGFSIEPSLWIVFPAAAIAVCALVVPGVSGSFFLLAIGLYSPTLRAVDERDLAYMGVFLLGAIVGLATIVRLVKWTLDHHRRVTLITMAGLMFGSLRALWPWQELDPGQTDGVGRVVAPTDPLVMPIVLALLGAAAVATMILIERRALARLRRAEAAT